MKLNRAELRNAFDVIDHVKPTAVLDSSQFVRLISSDKKSLLLTMTGTMWATSRVTTDSTEKWVVYVDRKVLKAFLDSAGGTDITITQKNKQLVIQGANQSLNIPSHTQVGGYETIPNITGTQIDATDELKNIVSLLLKYTPKIAGMENVDAVAFVPKIGVFASDSIFVCLVVDPKQQLDLVLPTSSALVLASLGGKLTASTEGVGVKLHNGNIWQPMPDKLDQYPKDDLVTYINKASKLPVRLNLPVSDLSEALQAAHSFVTDPLSQHLDISLEKTNFTIVTDTHGGKFRRTVKATVKKAIDPLKWPCRNILPWLGSLKKDGEVEMLRMATSNASEDCTVLRSETANNKTLLMFTDM